MYVYATLKVIFFLMIGYIGKPDQFRRAGTWIFPAVLYWLIDVITSYYQYTSGLNPIVGAIIVTPVTVLFFMSLFQYSALKSYVFSIVLIPLQLFPELIFAIPVAILNVGIETSSRVDQNLSVFSYMPSYVVLYFLREQIKCVFIWFESCSDEFIVGLMVICLNTNWFMVATNATIADAHTFASQGQMLYIILMGTVIINSLPASLIYKSIRKTSQQSKSHSITIAKSMLSDYLSQIHDLKNIAQVLNITPQSDFMKDISVVEKMIELKKSRARKDGVEVVMSSQIATEMLGEFDCHHPFFNSLDCSIITGIFLDNAIEHVKANEHLDRTIALCWSPESHTFSVSNPITSEGVKFLSDHAKGKSTKKDTLLSGYGLANAKELAKQSNVKIESQIVESMATFSLIYGA